MKFIRKSVFVLIGLFSLLSLMVYSPQMALAAKADKTSKTAKADASDNWGKPNAAFDINKMSDMSDFDPAHPVIPTGDVITIAHVAPFSGPAAIAGELHYASLAWAVHDIN